MDLRTGIVDVLKTILLTCPTLNLNINPVMKNTEVLNGILDELEVIKLRAEHFEKQSELPVG